MCAVCCVLSMAYSVLSAVEGCCLSVACGVLLVVCCLVIVDCCVCMVSLLCAMGFFCVALLIAV